MSDNKIKKKLGARDLTDKEIEKILPTYNNIYKQIEDMRNIGREYTDLYTDNNNLDYIQTLNNIGILGSRGSGKTSVIKTLSKKLQKDNPDDIILPLIVPENMSEKINLMSTIIGLLKNELDNILKHKEDNNKNKNCWEKEDSDLEKKFNKMLNAYITTQPQYQEVSLNQFSTENNYFKTYSNIYAQEISFHTYFNDFINSLLIEREKLSNSKNKDNMIFIFLDDIDLSTNRCTDVVKTLLIYLSHFRIVTIVSGDLETFEEALTVDFARMDNVLEKGILDTKFLNNNTKTMMESKQLLAYEYLKKIIPPALRHSVKKWSIFDRHSYSISIDNEGDELKEKVSTMGELINDIFGMDLKKNFNVTAQYRNAKTNTIEPVEYIYHIFDDTSRGLNNVYNALIDIKNLENENLEENELKSQFFICIKSLLETIVDSKKDFNDIKNLIFEKFIIFGNDIDDSYVNFNNFDIYSDKTIKIENLKIFMLLDFSCRLLEKYNEVKDEISYHRMKILNLNILFCYPEISGNNNVLSIVEFNAFFNNILEKNNNTILSVIFNMIAIFDFHNALILYKLIFANNNQIIDYTYNESQETADYLLYNLYYALSSIGLNSYLLQYDHNQKDIKTVSIIHVLDAYNVRRVNDIRADAREYNENRMNALLQIMQYKIRKNAITQIISATFYDIKIEKSISTDSLYSMLIDNTINKYFEDEKNCIIDNNKLTVDMNYIITYLESQKNSKKNIDLTSKFKIINTLNKSNLWNNTLSINVVNSIKREVKRIINDYFIKSQTTNSMIYVENIHQLIIEFSKIEKGNAKTLVSRLSNMFVAVFGKINEKNKLELVLEYMPKYIPITIYYYLYAKVKDLAYNHKAWYGVREANIILSELRKCNLSIQYINTNCIKIINDDNKKDKYFKDITSLESYNLNNLSEIIFNETNDASLTTIEHYKKIRKLVYKMPEENEIFIEEIKEDKILCTDLAWLHSYILCKISMNFMSLESFYEQNEIISEFANIISEASSQSHEISKESYKNILLSSNTNGEITEDLINSIEELFSK